MLKLAEIFQSGMVLQQGKRSVIWGTADGETAVTVCIQGQQIQTTSGENGEWIAVLAPLRASEEETLQITAGTEQLVITDVAVGEVWIAGGQSNMEFHMRYEKHLSEVKPACYNPQIRFFDVPEVAYAGQKEQFDYSAMGRWRKATPEDIDFFSAVGYYFSRELEQTLDVPVGIIGCNWGGTNCAAWMNLETVRTAGPDWMAEYDAFASKTDMASYFAKQRFNPMNSRGTPFADPFSEFIMPKTRTQEELDAFFAGLGFDTPEIGGDIRVQNIPGTLYENMVKTIAPFAVRGVLWYQGESDDVPGRQQYYQAMLTGMIHDWRVLWKEELPFLIVQLPGFEHWLDNVCMDYETIREAQRSVTEAVENTWLCSISDAGEQYDIHPKNKKVVGYRLAMLAKSHIYSLPVFGDAPAAVSAYADDGRLNIVFANADTGLVCSGNGASALHVYAGKREIGVRAEPKGNTLVLIPDEPLTGTVTVHFAKGNWYQVNLYNQEGIPAIPFSLQVDF